MVMITNNSERSIISMKKIRNITAFYNSSSITFMSDVMTFISKSLKDMSVDKKLIQKAELISEEIIADLLKHAPANTDLNIQVKRSFGEASVNLSMKGEEFSPYSDEDDLNEDSGIGAIRSVLLRSFGENFKYSNKNHVNNVRIVAGQSEKKMNNSAIYALFLGLVFGFIAKFLFPESVNTALCSYILEPIKTIFMNAIRIIIAPVVFFSIVSCFSQFTNLSEVGKIGSRVISMYLLTTVIAVILGISIFYIVQPGEFGFALSSGTSTQTVNVDTSVDTSIMSTLLNIVPSNFLTPFLESDTLQLIFLAMLCGIAVGMVGKYSSMLKELFDALNTLFLTITTLITRFIPLAAFVSISLLVIRLGGNSLLSILSVTLTHTGAILCMMCIYGILILIIGRLNPLKFFKNDKEGIFTSLTLSSSSAAMPTNMRVCTEKLGVSPKVANFSIPLGATINMDGVCIYLTVIGLFLAKAYGITIDLPSLISLTFTIIMLSLGAPGVPGCAFICLSVVAESLNIPIEALSLIIAINPILDMTDTMSNTTGDMAAAVIVAKKEGLLDLEKYNS